MRKTKRILAMLLTVVMLASCMTTAVVAANGKFSDVKTDAIYAAAVETLSKMGVINGYEDGTFRPDQNVTRAEFTAMLMRTLNYGSLGATSAAALPFTDLSDADTSINWSFPNINTAYNMGIINGYEDSTFRPKNNVAYEEALKMIVCTLGYTGIDASTNPWYSNYVAQANRLGITDVAASLGQVETPATRACIAQMLYDALEAKICENDKVTDKTILTSYLGFVKNTGVISSDGVTGLTAPDVNLEDNEVEIYAPEADGTYQVHKYETEDETLKNYLGCQVDFYYKSTGSRRVLQFCVLTQNKELTLTPELIEDTESSNTQIRYYKSADSDATTNVNLDSDNVVIYNGKLYGATDKDSRFDTSMLPKIGSVTLIDSDNDNKYDVVKIESYEVYYVSSKVTADETIVDDVTRTGDARKVVLDEDNTTIKDTEGRTIKFSSIPTDSIICLAKTNDANGGEVIQNAVLVTEAVTGTVTGTKGKTNVSINNVSYEYSPAAPWMDGNSGTQEAPQLEDEGKYLMDINGKIVAYKKDATTANIGYGYLMGIAKGDSTFSDSKSARVLTAGGSEGFYTIDTSTKVDGKSYETTDEIVEALEKGAKTSNTDGATNLTVQQVIKYTTATSNGETVLKEIYLAEATATGQTVEATKLNYYTKVDADTAMTYKSSAKQLSGGGVNVSIANALVFVVPTNRIDYDEYAVKKDMTTIFKNSEEYNVELFEVATNVAKVVVCYGADSSRTVDAYTVVSVVTELGNASNKTAGKNMDYMSGFIGSSSSFNELWISDQTPHTPQAGDIFRAGADKDGYATVQTKDVIYKVAGGNTYGQFSSGDDFYSSPYAVVMGSVYKIENDIVSIMPEYVTKGDVLSEADIAKVIPFTVSDLSKAKVLEHDYENDNVTFKEVVAHPAADAEGVLKGMTPYNEEGLASPTKVMIYLYEGSVRMVCILGDNIAE